jgi:hypothetical protein
VRRRDRVEVVVVELGVKMCNYEGVYLDAIQLK